MWRWIVKLIQMITRDSSGRVVGGAGARFVAAMRTVNTQHRHTAHITQFFMRTCASTDRPDHNPDKYLSSILKRLEPHGSTNQ